jgi:hypothetical protein
VTSPPRSSTARATDRLTRVADEPGRPLAFVSGVWSAREKSWVGKLHENEATGPPVGCSARALLRRTSLFSCFGVSEGLGFFFLFSTFSCEIKPFFYEISGSCKTPTFQRRPKSENSSHPPNANALILQTNRNVATWATHV